jgi:glycosidase
MTMLLLCTDPKYRPTNCYTAFGMSKTARPTFEFHVSRAARDRYQFDDALFTITGNLIFANFKAALDFALRMNRARETEQHPEQTVSPAALNAMGLIDETLHALVAIYREQRDPYVIADALRWFEERVGRENLDRTLLTFAQEFPAVAVYRGEKTAPEWLLGSTAGVPNRNIAFEELVMLWLANANPAFRPYQELFDDKLLAQTAYEKITPTLREYFETRPRFGPDDQNLVDMLRAPALASPSLAGQLAFIRDKWSKILGEGFRRLLLALDVLKEEEIAVWLRFHPPAHGLGGPGFQGGDSSAAAIPHFGLRDFEYERFSQDVDWMPRTVMVAKTAYVWLDQLSRQYGRSIRHLNEIPDEELNVLARRGFNALWLIGIWERSRASQRIKQLTGNPEAAASAYSLMDYRIADDLGGDSAYNNLRDRATLRGIRLASDMVPNHMGIDSDWVIEHPDWFISLPQPPYPVYSYTGPDLSSDGRVLIQIEDHYYNRTDAAVVFKRQDRWTGDTRYIYHGNDGTSFPWNDTAQLNYLKPEVREAVIQTILHVARMSPIIRFDAAMTLTKRHYQRLWFPEPGTGGAIPSRAEHGLTKGEFDAAMPHEFWRELVDRVAAEVPGTLLLAEAFWLLEGYFVRTLGMHRVYNSAFMNMLRDEENANYRSVIKNTLEFDPEVLKRYVNFMNNPDERTAVDQFGKGDKYFGVCTMMCTLPGLPMFGHGQIEGYTERYGMEYRRAYYDESPDQWLIARHEREISPLLHRRGIFAEVENFLLYDFFTENGTVNEDVFAYSNRIGNQRALVVYHNRFGDTRGWIRASVGYRDKVASSVRQKTLGDSFGLSGDGDMYVAFRDVFTGLEYLHRSRDLADKGMRLELGAYNCHVFLDWRDLREDETQHWGALCDMLGGRGVSSLSDALHALALKPVHDAAAALLDPALVDQIAQAAQHELAGAQNNPDRDGLRAHVLDEAESRTRHLLIEAHKYSMSKQAEAHGLGPANRWDGDLDTVLAHFRSRLEAVLRVPEFEGKFDERWPEEARQVLPSANSPAEDAPAIWATVLAFCAVEALGHLNRPDDPDHASGYLFDSLRLRNPLAQSLALLGLPDDRNWRAAARIRTAFAHAPWAPGAEVSRRQMTTRFSWLHDPDVAWLIGVHEYEGVRYFNKEQAERLLWWMSLRSLLDLAAKPEPDRESVRRIEHEIQQRARAAADAGYQVEALFAMAEQRENSPK